MAERVFLTDAQLRARYGGLCSRTTMRWRKDGTGPEYMRANGRILYPLGAVETWERSRQFPHRAAEAVRRMKADAPANSELTAN